MFRPGLCSVTFRALSCEQVVQLAAEAGLQGIEWGSDVHVPADQPSRARAVRQMTRDAGLEVASYGTYYRLGDSDPYPFEAYVESALELGAPRLRIWAGRKGSDELDVPQWERLVDDARRVAELASDAGLAIACEFHSHTATDSATAAVQLLEAVDHLHCGIYWQATIGMTAPQNLAELDMLLPWVVNVHCFHWPTRPQGQQPLADGLADWRRYLRPLNATGKTRWLLLEFTRNNDPHNFRADAAALQQLLAGP